MSKGALIFAFDTKDFCYTQLAEMSARKIQQHLDIPVTLVTNNLKVTWNLFDKIIPVTDVQEQSRLFKNHNELQQVKWLNTDRLAAYSLTPYDQTLVVDADYFVFNNNLKKLFDTNIEVACYNEVFDITNQNRLNGHKRLANVSIPMQWATVLYFTQNELADNVFSFMKHIKKHYSYYAKLYHFNESLYRNDFALSIALQALTGYSTKNFTKIPGKLFTVDTSVKLIDVDFNKEHVVYQVNDKVCKIQGESLHIMNKFDLATFLQKHHA